MSIIKLLEAYPPELSGKDILYNLLFWGIGVLLYVGRNTEIIRPIWKLYKLFLYLLFATLLFGFIKERFKSKE